MTIGIRLHYCRDVDSRADYRANIPVILHDPAAGNGCVRAKGVAHNLILAQPLVADRSIPYNWGYALLQTNVEMFTDLPKPQGLACVESVGGERK